MRPSGRFASVLGVWAAIVSCAATSHDTGAGRAPDIARACAGLSDTDVANAMAALKPNIESVDTKYETVFYPKGSPAQRLAGAVVEVRATPGTTAQWLTRVLSCHALRHVPELCAAKDRCPLALEGASVGATARPAGFAVSIEAKDPEIAQEIVRRTRELAPSP